ncbi:MAG TPA: hypothetical protein VFT99_13855, partial [Roseiflexaceae bacterium]|nr:hypothetical protein [Roseiflexaceae bacterium]
RLAFAHDLVRSATVALIGGPRRRLLHRQLALALEQLHGTQPEYAAEITAHLQRSGRGSELRVVQYAVLAGQNALYNLGYQEARRFFAIALQIASQPELHVPPELSELAELGMRRVAQALGTPS